MIAGSTLVTFNDAATKFVVEEHPVSQALFIRALFTLVPILWMIHHAGGWETARWRSLKAQLFCAVPLVGAMVLFIYSLSLLPIAIATIIFYLSPLFVTIIAPFLGERVGVWRWGAVIIGFLGAILVVEPGRASFTWAFAVPVVAAFVLAWRDIAARIVVAQESSLGILVFSTGAIALVTLVPAIAVWEALSWREYALLAFAGVAFGISLYLLTDAFRYAEASLISPIKYSGLIAAALLGYFVWGDVPSLSALMGAALIVVSVLVIMQRERAAGLGRKPDEGIVND